MDDKRVIKVFISSPGDVRPERLIARRVVEQLDREFSFHFHVEPVLWERQPLVATEHFQTMITPPSQADIVVVLLWSRLGSPLPSEEFQGRVSGRAPVTGTEWEFEDAVAGYREQGRPDLLVYRKTRAAVANLDDDLALDERRQQKRVLEAFVSRWFVDQESGSFIAASHMFESAAELENMLAEHLRALLRQQLEDELQTEIRWHHGSPYRGLQAFELEHAPLFFGRTRARNELRELLVSHAAQGRGFVLVLGASGSGKSSLVNAGLLPDLMLPGMVSRVALVRHASFRPSYAAAHGGNLQQALAHALMQAGALPELGLEPEALSAVLQAPEAVRRQILATLSRTGREAGLTEHAEARLLLIVDQLEELFTVDGIDEAARDEFVAALDGLARSGGVWVVASLRSDFFDRLETMPRLAALSSEGRYLLTPPDESELAQIITQPAREAGLRFEVDEAIGIALDDVIREAAGRDPGALPMLEFLLDQLWYARTDRGVLTFDAYRRLGGLEGAIGRQAEAVFEQQAEDVQAAFPALIRALVTVGEGTGEEVARPTARTALVTSWSETTPLRRLAEALLSARLLVSDAKQLRVAHEALLTHWPRARRQIEVDRHDLEVRSRLETAAAQWRRANAADRASLLLSAGLPLSEGEDLLDRYHEELDDGVRQYVKASLDALRYAERRYRRRLQIVSAVFAMLAVLAGVGAWYGFKGQSEAQVQAQLAARRAEEALAAKQEAEIQRAAAEVSAARAEVARQEAQGQRSAAEAGRAEAERRRLEAQTSRLEAERQKQSARLQADRAESSRRQAQIGQSLYLSDLARRELEADDVGTAVRLALAALPREIGSGSRPVVDPAVEVLRDALEADRLIAVLDGGFGGVTQLSVSADGQRIATGHRQHAVLLWDVASASLLRRIPFRGYPKEAVLGVGLSPDGSLLAVKDQPGVTLWDGRNGEPLGMLEGVHPFTIAFSSTGERLLATTREALEEWDLNTRKRVRVYDPDAVPGETFQSESTAFWIKRQVQGYTHSLWGATSEAKMSSDGRWLATSGVSETTGAVRLWDVSTGQFIRSLGKGSLNGSWQPFVEELAFSPGNTRLAAVDGDGSLGLWQVPDGKRLARLSNDTGRIRWPAFSPDGETLLAAAGANTARVWRVTDGKLLFELEGHEDTVTVARFGPLGRTIATASRDGTVRLWDAGSGAPLAVLKGHSGPVTDVRFGPQGRFLASSSEDGTVRLWRGDERFPARTMPASDSDPQSASELKLWLSGSANSLLVSRASGESYARKHRYFFFDTSTGQLRVELESESEAVAFLGAHDTALIGKTWVGVASATVKRFDARAVVASADGRLFVAAGAGPEIDGVHDSASGEKRIARPPVGAYDSLRLSADGTRVAEFGARGFALWDTRDGSVLFQQATSRAVSDLAVSVDGERAITREAGGVTSLWDTGGSRLLRRLNVPGQRVTLAVFSPDGERALVAVDAGPVVLLDAASGRVIEEWDPFAQADSMTQYTLSEDLGAFFALSERPRSEIISEQDTPFGEPERATRRSPFSLTGELLDKLGHRWTASGRERSPVIRPADSAAPSFAVSDEAQVLVVCSDAEVTLVSVESGAMAHQLRLGAATGLSYESGCTLSADGASMWMQRRTAEGKMERVALDLKTGELSGTGTPLPEGKRLARHGEVGAGIEIWRTRDGQVRAWHEAAGRRTDRLAQRSDDAVEAAIDGTGRFAILRQQRSLRVFRLSDGASVSTGGLCSSDPSSIHLLGSQARALVSCPEGGLYVWWIGDDRRALLAPPGVVVESQASTADGSRALISLYDVKKRTTSVLVVDPYDAEIVARFEGFSASASMGPDLAAWTLLSQGDDLAWWLDLMSGQTVDLSAAARHVPFPRSDSNSRFVVMLPPESGRGSVKKEDFPVSMLDTQTGRLSALVSAVEMTAVHTLGVSTDGRWFWVAGHDGGLKIWDLETGMPHGVVSRRGSPVRAAWVLDGGERVLVFPLQGRPALWSLGGTGSPVELRASSGIPSRAESLGPSTGAGRGTTLLTAAASGTVRLWRASDGALLGTFESGLSAADPTTRLDVAAVHAVPGAGGVDAGHYLVIHALRYGTASLPQAYLLRGGLHGEPVELVGHESCAALIAAVDSSVVFATGDGLRRWTLPVDRGPVLPAAVVPAHDVVYVWGPQMSSESCRNLPVRNSEPLILVRGNGDATRAVSFGKGNSRIWDLQSKRMLAELGEGAVAATISDDGSLVAVVSRHEAVSIWSEGSERGPVTFTLPPDLHSGSELPLFDSGKSPDLRRVRYTNDQEIISHGTTVTTWNLDERRFRQWPAVRSRKSEDENLVLGADGAQALVYKPQQRKLRLLSRDASVPVVEINAPDVLAQRVRKPGALSRFVYDPSRRFILVPGVDGRARVFDLWTGRTIVRTRAGERITAAAFDSDGQRLAVANTDGVVRLWHLIGDADERVLSQARSIHPIGIRRLSFTPGARRLLVHGALDKLSIWDVASGENVQVFKPRFAGAASPAWNQDASRLLLDDGMYARLVDAQSARDVARIGPIARRRYDVSEGAYSSMGVEFSKWGRFLTAWDGDAYRLWEAATGAQISVAQQETYSTAGTGTTAWADTVRIHPGSDSNEWLAFRQANGSVLIHQADAPSLTVRALPKYESLLFDAVARRLVIERIQAGRRIHTLHDLGNGEMIAHLFAGRASQSGLIPGQARFFAWFEDEDRLVVWNTATGSTVLDIHSRLPDDSGARFIVSADHQLIGALHPVPGDDGNQRRVVVYSLATGEQIAGFDVLPGVTDIIRSDEGYLLVNAPPYTTSVQTWLMSSGVAREPLNIGTAQSDPMPVLELFSGPGYRPVFAMSAAGERVALRTEFGRVAVVNTSDGKRLAAFATLSGRDVSQVRMSASGRLLAVVDQLGGLRIHKVDDASRLLDLPDQDSVRWLRATPRGEAFVYSGEDGRLTWFAAEQGPKLLAKGSNLEAELQVHYDPSGGFGALLRAGRTAVEVIGFDAHTGTTLGRFEAEAKRGGLVTSPGAIVLEAKRRRIVVVPKNNIGLTSSTTVSVYDMDAGEPVRVVALGPVSGSVRAAAIHPHLDRVAVVSGTQVKVFDVSTRQVVRTLAGAPPGATALVYRPDGAWLAAVGPDGSAAEWDLAGRSVTGMPVQDLLDYAHAAFPAPLTPAQERAYFITRASEQEASLPDERTPAVGDSATISSTTATAAGRCDALAADPDDRRRTAKGVILVDIDQAAAVEACTAAMAGHPDEARFAFQLGRAYLAAQRWREASGSLLRAGETGYGPALRTMYDYWGDDARAMQWLLRAVKAGDPEAMSRLARWRLLGSDTR